jgi:hypothetical protein
MTREEFIAILDEKDYSYEIEGDKIVVTEDGAVDLYLLKTIPTDVVFNNGGYVALSSLQTIPPGVELKNGEDVLLYSLTSLPPGVEFRNGGSVNLESLIGGWFNHWKGNIEGIDSKSLFNVMIKRGMFI